VNKIKKASIIKELPYSNTWPMRHAIGPVTQTSPLIHDQIPEEESYDEDPDEHPGESKITISIE
jgi:hypothetical protein